MAMGQVKIGALFYPSLIRDEFERGSIGLVRLKLMLGGQKQRHTSL